MRNTLSTCTARLVSRLAFFTVLLLGLSSWAAADPSSYTVEDLGVLPGDSSSVAWAVNANGDVVGWSMGQAGSRAFLYTSSGGMAALPGLPDKPRTVARDINDAGVIVGSANAGGTDLGHAVLWSGGSVQDLGTLGTGYFSEAWGVNNAGQVVGWSYTNGGSGLTGVHGFRYTQAEGLVDLTPNSDTGNARDINDAGQVTGYKTTSGGVYHAFRWTGGTFIDLGVVPGFGYSFGLAINAAGQVAGNSTSSSGNSERFFRFTDGTGLENLGGVGEHNVAWGINASGQVVGTSGNSVQRAHLYTDEAGLQDLNTLIDPSLGWVITGASDINDAGQIVGHGFNSFTGLTHAVRLQPTTAPPPECTINCLRSTDITLRAQQSLARRFTVTAKVTVQDENGHLMSEALVVGIWTHPNGTRSHQYAWTGRRGVASFATAGSRRGTYTLEVVNIELSRYTFNPSESILSRSITVN